MAKIVIQFLGHACFRLTFDEWAVVVDPYAAGSVDGLRSVKGVTANEVFKSHDHHDHNALDLITIEEGERPAELTVTEVATFHDNEGGAKRGPNTVHVFEYDGVRIAHFGDLGHELSEEQIEEIGKLDYAMMPVGGFFTVDPATAKIIGDSLGCRIIPMHYRGDGFGFDRIASIYDFTRQYESVRYETGSTYEIGVSPLAEVIVLKPEMAGN